VAGVATTVGLWTSVNETVTSAETIDGGALVSSGGQTVSVTGISACDWTGVRLAAAEQPDRVVLTLQYTRPTVDTCSGMPDTAVYSARLQAPLGHRTLVDGATGKPVSFFDSRRILRPSYLPAAYTFRYDAPDASGLLGYEYLAAPRGATASCTQLYSADGDEYDRLLVVIQAYGGELEWPPRTKPRPVTVHGRRALGIPGRISWTQDGQTIIVAANDPGLPAPELLRVADSVGDGAT
jgi:hypothetical protein